MSRLVRMRTVTHPVRTVITGEGAGVSRESRNSLTFGYVEVDFDRAETHKRLRNVWPYIASKPLKPGRSRHFFNSVLGFSRCLPPRLGVALNSMVPSQD